LVARRRDRLEELAARLKADHGTSTYVLVADLTTADGIDAVGQACTEATTLKFVVNNAGFGGYGPFLEISKSTIDALIAIHVTAVAQITNAAVSSMSQRDGGVVLNIASLLAFSGSLPPDPLPYRAVYAGAKSFITIFSRTLAKELAQSKIKLHVCLPGLVDTEFHGERSLGPAMSADDVVTAAMTAIQRNETVCIPTLRDLIEFESLVQAEQAMVKTARNRQLAERYVKKR
jgi:short-subunit dehydrogenase